MLSPQVTTLSYASIEMFRNSLSARGRSKDTIRAYTTDLRMLLLALGEEEVPLTDFESRAMYWLATAKRERVVAPKTVGRRLTSCRVFAKWAGIPNPLEDFSAPTMLHSDPHPLPEGMDGVRRMIEAATSEKQRALITLGGFFGCRVSEALSVRPSSFDLSGMTLKIRGKGDKTRLVPVSDESWGYLSIPVGRAFVRGMDEYVVGMKDRFARRVVTEIGRRAQLQRKVASHDLRATFATELYNRTQDARLVQILMGHESIDTTTLYIAVTGEKFRRAVNAL